MNPPVAIGVAPTGARKSQADHPALPLSPREIAATAARCQEAGACLLHLHVRKPAGGHSLEADDYRPALAAVRQAVGERLVVQLTTEAVSQYAPAQQVSVVKALHPEAASVALREIAPDEASLPLAADFFAWMHREGIIAQVILYSASDVQRYHELFRRGVIPAERQRHWVLFALGRYSGQQEAQPAELLPFLAAWEGTPIPWAVCAFGRHEAACVTAALTLGGHARVGFENNVVLPDGRRAAGNEDLVAGVARMAALLALPLADADTLRSWFKG